MNKDNLHMDTVDVEVFAIALLLMLSSEVLIIIIIIIIIIKRKDLGGVMSKDCNDTVQTLKTVTKRDCDAEELIE